MTEENNQKTSWKPGQDPNPNKKEQALEKEGRKKEKKDNKEKKVADEKNNVEKTKKETQQNKISNEANQQQSVENIIVSTTKKDEIPQSAQPSAVVDENSSQTIVYKKGCCRAAWGDVRSTKGWFGKVCLLSLIEFVPILNWVNLGYALRWARELFVDKIQDMPKKIFGNRVFVTGAMQFLISLVVAIALGFAITMLDIIPVAGALLGLVFAIVVGIVMDICYIRMAIFDSLSEGFAINKGFVAAKKHFGKAFCAGVVPAIIATIIMIVIISVATVVIFQISGESFYKEFLKLSSQYSSTRSFEYSLQTDKTLQLKILMLAVNLISENWTVLLVACYLISVCAITTNLVTMRAMGHFVARYCEDWKKESKFTDVLEKEKSKLAEEKK